MLCSVLRRVGKLRTLGNCPRLRARAGADRRQVTRQSIPVIFKIYEVLYLAVVDVPVELCVTRLRYAQIHRLFSRMLARHQTAPASPSCAGSPGPAGRGRLGDPRRACGINQVSLLARIRLSLTGHHSWRAALRFHGSLGPSFCVTERSIRAVSGKRPGGHIAACGLAWLNRTRPDRRISLPSSVSVPRSKLRNRIAQLPSSRWASAIVSFRNASDR